MAGVLAGLRGEPSRVWSIVVTVFGDAVVPRGGVVWLGTLVALFGLMGVGAGAVRTAASRLVADGWLARTRVGREGFYALGARGRGEFERAAALIYGVAGDAAGTWDGGPALVFADAGGREALEAAGFGTVAPGVWFGPGGAVPPGLLRVAAGADAATGRALAARAWPLGGVAAGYARLIGTFGPVAAALDGGWMPEPGEAMVARTLLIHQYRRAVLRDPLLPRALLPQEWPGFAARALVAGLYTRLADASERWLDAHGRDAAGPLPPPGAPVAGRFSGGAGARREG